MVFESWSTAELLSFFMVLIRISTLVMLLPVFGDKVVPSTVKILLSLTFSAVLFPVLKSSGMIRLRDAEIWSETSGKLLMTIGTEVLVGIGVGFASQLVFHAIQIAGDFMSQLMGFSMASMYDPHMETQTVVLGQLFSALAMLTFLALDGHHMLFRAMVETFHSIPQGHLALNEAFKNSMLGLVKNTLLFGIQLSAPMAACMLLVNIVYGVLSKALPQLNVLTLSMAASALIGSLVLIVTYPGIQSGMSNIFYSYFEDLRQFLVVYGGK
ncbi:MAG: flagellar biosynthetic protein FliR [Proteobacteria bacterium]|nr:flagellar biosynthetic protein FliR [Pseudomonadota bacterium]